MHDVADASSDDHHLAAVGLAHPYDAAQAPVGEIRVAFGSNRAKPSISSSSLGTSGRI